MVLGRRLYVMARLAKGLDVIVVVASALVQRDDMIDDLGNPDDARALAMAAKRFGMEPPFALGLARPSS